MHIHVTNFLGKTKLKIQQQDFLVEVTTKLSLLNENIVEIPISYNGRSYKEGKKMF